MYNNPIFKSESTAVSPKGTTAQPNKLSKNVIIGARIKINVFALLGKIDSLTNNFKPSAKGCSKPQIPTTAGPRRRWIDASTLRSAKVKYATEINKGTTIISIFNKVIIFNWGADYSAGAIIGLISLALIEFCNSKVYYLDDEMEYTKQMLLDDTPQFLNEIQKHKNRPQPKSRPITTPKKKKSFWDKLFGK